MRSISTIFIAGALVVSASSAAAMTEKAEPASAAPRDKMVCKRFTRIGSLVDSYKTCKTKSEWDREHANLRAAGQSGYCGPRETIAGTSVTSC